jgi:hypothetical protein
MSLGDLTRDMLAFADDFTRAEGLQGTVTLETFASEDDANKPTYATPALALTAIVQESKRNVPTSTGWEHVHGADVFFPRPTAIGLKDRLTLPDGKVGIVRQLNGVTDAATGSPFYRSVFVGYL